MQTLGRWLAKSLLCPWIALLQGQGRSGAQSRFWTWLALAWLAATSIPGSSSSSASQTNGDRPPATRVSSEQFIAAFELTAKGDFRFTWPPDSMRPAPYERVMLVVEKMPHVWNSNEGRSSQLRARDHLRINDQPPRTLPDIAGERQVETVGSAESFLVNLDKGRLRIRVLISPDLRLDPLHNSARIRLYRHTGSND